MLGVGQGRRGLGCGYPIARGGLGLPFVGINTIYGGQARSRRHHRGMVLQGDLQIHRRAGVFADVRQKRSKVIDDGVEATSGAFQRRHVGDDGQAATRQVRAGNLGFGSLGAVGNNHAVRLGVGVLRTLGVRRAFLFRTGDGRPRSAAIGRTLPGIIGFFRSKVIGGVAHELDAHRTHGTAFDFGINAHRRLVGIQHHFGVASREQQVVDGDVVTILRSTGAYVPYFQTQGLDVVLGCH